MYDQQAYYWDSKDCPIEGTAAYERLLTTDGGENLDTWLNLSVWYFVIADYGYATYHHLPNEFVKDAFEHAFELLDSAQSRFGEQVEITFWRRYFDFILVGGEPFVRECMELVQADPSGTLVPYFYLFASGKEQYRAQAEELYAWVKDGSTARKRYIRSVLDASFANTNLHNTKKTNTSDIAQT